MTDDIQFGGVRYLSAADAAVESNLTRDYVAKLCREGKVNARRVGKNWFVEPGSLSEFLGSIEQAKNERNEKLSAERRKEYRGGDISREPEEMLSRAKTSELDLDVGLPHREMRSAPKVERVSAVARNIFPDHDKHSVPKIHTMEHARRRAAYQQAVKSFDVKDKIVNVASFVPLPSGLQDAAVHANHARAVVQPTMEFAHKVAALAFALVITFGIIVAFNPQAGAYAIVSARSLVMMATDPEGYVREENLAASSSDSNADLTNAQIAAAGNPVIGFFGGMAQSFSSNIDSFFAMFTGGSQGTVTLNVTPIKTQPAPAPTYTYQPTPAPAPVPLPTPVPPAAPAPSPVQVIAKTQPPTTITQVTHERVIDHVTVERVVSEGGISEALLNSRLAQLRSTLEGEMSANSIAYSPDITKLYQAISLSGGGGGGSVTNVTNVNNTDAAALTGGVVAIAHGGIATSTAPIYGQVLVGNGNGGYSLLATSSLNIAGAASSPGGASGSVQFNNGGTFGGASVLFYSNATGRVGIGTTSPAASIAVAGNAYVGGTITATGTLSMLGTGTSTIAGGLNINNNGLLYDPNTNSVGVGGFAGVAALSNSPIALQVNRTGMDAVVAINTNSSGRSARIEFGIDPMNGVAEGYVGLASSSIRLMGGGSQGYPLVLGVNNTEVMRILGDRFSPGLGNVGIGTTSPGSIFSLGSIANFTAATSSFYSTGGINIASGCFSVNGVCIGTSAAGGFSTTSTDYWQTQRNFFSTTSANYWASGINFFSTTSADYFASQRNFFSSSSASFFTDSSTTIPKTYANNTFTGNNAFNGTLTYGSLTGPLQAVNGVVSATSTVSAVYGGTGISNPSSGGVLIGTYSGGAWMQLGTSSLAINTNNLVEGNANLFYTNARVQTYLGTVDKGFFFSTTSASYFADSSTTIPKTYSANTFTGSNTFTGALAVGSLNGPLQANNGVVSATTTVGVLYGGTGLSVYTAGDLLYANTPTSLSRISAGTGGTILAMVNGIPTWTATTTLATISGQLNLASQVVGVLPVLNGGTGWGNVAAGTILYGSGTGALATTTAGTPGYVLAYLNGIPTWTPTSTLSTITGTLATTKGGTGITSYNTGDVIYADSANHLTVLPVGSNGTVLKLAGGVPTWGTDLTTGGGGGAGAWSTTTDSLAVYPTNTSNVVIIGSNATATLSSIFEVSGKSYFSNNVGIGTTTAGSILSIGGVANFAAGNSTFYSGLSVGNLTATSSLTVAGNTTLANATTTSFAIGNIANGSLLKITTGGAVTAALPGSDYANFNYLFPNNATSTLLTFNGGLVANGTVGIGTSTPYGKFAVSLNNGDTNANAFIVASSTSNSTTTLFSISNTGTVNRNLDASTSTLETLAGRTFLTASTTGFNTSLGINALSRIAGGSTNTALGYQALQNATSSTDNVAIGYQALQGTANSGQQQRNIAIGNGALTANINGNDNLAFGYQSMFTNTTGVSNLAIGNFSLYSNRTGNFNAVVGDVAGQGSGAYSASGLTFLGYGAGFNILSGADNNTLIGEQAGYNITTGANNIVVGADNTGTNNTLTTGSRNILIGYDIGLASSTGSNQLDIGNLLFGQGISGTTGAAPSTGTIGIGTSTPFGKFAISLNNGDTSFYNNAFVIASSTGSATTTLFSISNAGALTQLGGATSTFSNGFNLSSGCFAVNGVCVGGSGSGNVTGIGNGLATTTAASLYFSTSSSASNGLTSSLSIGATSNGLSFTPALSGTLAVAGGGTGISSFTAGDILYANTPTSLARVGSTTSGTVLALVNGIPTWTATTTFSGGLAYAGGNVTLDSNFDKGFFFSTTSSNYWKTQNNFFSTTSAIYFTDSSTTIPKTYTNNTFAGLQTFLNASTTNITASYASTTAFYGASLNTCQAGNFLTWNNGQFGCSVASAGPSIFSYLSNFGTTTAATTTSIFTQGVFFSSSTVAASQLPYASSTAITAGTLFATNDIISGNTTLTNATTTSFAVTNINTGSLLKVTTGGALTAALLGTDYINWSFPFTPTTFGGIAANSTSTLMGFTGGLYGLGSSTLQNVTMQNSTTTNATTTSFAIANLSNGLLKANTNGSVLLATPGVDYLTSGSLYPFPFSSFSTFGTTSSATSTSLYTAGVFFSSSTKAASQFPYASSTMFTASLASTTDLVVSNVPATLLKTDVSGKLVAAVPNVDYATGGSGSVTWQIANGALVPTTTLGIIVSASSTIGGANGGLTIQGSATTTSNLYVAGSLGVGTNAPAGALDVRIPDSASAYLGSSNVQSIVQFSNGQFVSSGGKFRITGGTRSGVNTPLYFDPSGFGISANTEAMVITTGNLVGIGTNNPQSRLDVSGGISAGSYAGSAAAPTNGLVVSGSSGIGTSSPSGFFAVQSPAAQTNPVFVVSTSSSYRNLLSIAADGFGTTTINGLNINGFATTTSNVGINLSSGCFSVSGVCLTSAASLLGANNTWTGTNTFNTSVTLTNATTTSFAITNINAGSLLKATTGGALTAAVAGTDYLAGNTTLFSTTSAIYFTDSSTTIPKTYTNNIFTGLQTFNSASTTALSATNASTTNLVISSLNTSAGQCLSIDATGKVTAQSCTTGGFAFPFTTSSNFGAIVNATNTPIWFQQGLQASSTAWLSTVNLNGALNLAATSSTSVLATFAGQSLLIASTTGNNTGLGLASLGAITSGARNTTIGYQALLNATSTSDNTAIGYQALTGNASNFSGNANVAVGSNALSSVSAASNNVGIGVSALSNANTGGNNLGVGSLALSGVNSGVGNIGFGYHAGNTITSGFYNVVLGGATNITTGSNNIVIGEGSDGFSGLNVPNAAGNNQLNIQGIIFGTNNAGLAGAPSAGQIGIGTSTPWGRLAVSLNNGDTNTNAFLIASSTGSATTTLFSISNTGVETSLALSTGGATSTSLFVNGSSTIAGTFSASGNTFLGGTLNVAGNTTLANATTTSLAITNLANGSLLKVTTGGAVTAAVAGTDYLTNATTLFSTTSAIFFTDASTTIPKTYSSNTFTNSNTFTGSSVFNGTLAFVNATGTTLFANALTANQASFGATGTTTITNAGLLGVGTSSPWARLAVNPIAGDTNQFVVGSSSQTSLLITAGGNVGIGKVSPTKTLDVNGTGKFSSTLTLGSIITCTGGSALQTDASGNISCGAITISGASSGGGWTTNATGFVQLSTSTDQVGLGTSSPYAKLSIVSGATATTTLALVPTSGQTANILDIYNTAGSLASVFTAAGNFGIGTTSPGSALSVAGNQYISGTITSGSNIASQFPYASSTAFTAGNLFATNATTTSLAITNLANGSLLKVTTGGAVTAAVVGTDFSNFGYLFPNNATNTLLAFNGGLTFTNATGTTLFANALTANQAVFGATGSTTITPTGFLGVGTTSPWGLLSVNPNGLTNGAPAFVVGSSSATKFIVTNGGNVGIGTTTPDVPLSIYTNAAAANVPVTTLSLDVKNTGGSITGFGPAIDFRDGGGTTIANMARIAAVYELSPASNSLGALAFYTNADASASNSAPTEKMRLSAGGNLGLGTTSPYARLTLAANFYDQSTSTTLFLIASSTASATTTLFSIDNTGLVTGQNSAFTNATTTSLAITNLSTQAGQCLTISATGAVTTQSCTTGNFAYLFPANATSTLLNFNGGLTSYASTTIGNGTATGGLTVNGTATTTNLIFSGLQSALLKVNAQGQVSAAVSGTDYAAFAYPFVGNATTTQIAFNGGLTFTAATGTTIFANVYSGNQLSIGATATTTITSQGTLGIGTTSPSALFAIGASPTTTTQSLNLFTISSSTALWATTTLFNISNTGLVTGLNQSFTNSTSTSLGATNAIITYANFTGATTSALYVNGSTTISGILAVSGSAPSYLSFASSTALTAGNFFSTNSTITNLTVTGATTSALFVNGSSTIAGILNVSGAATLGSSLNVAGNTTLANATTTSLAITNLANGSLLKVTTGGALTAAVAGTDYLTNATTLFSTTSAIYFTDASTTIPKTYTNNTFTGSNTFNGTLAFVNATGTSIFDQSEYALTANFGATATTTITSAGRLGIGTTSPWGLLSIFASPTTTPASLNLFSISSSTSNWATSTLFAIDNTGLVTGQNFSFTNGTTTSLGATNAILTNLTATGATTSALYVSGSSTILNAFNVSGAATFGSSLSIAGGTTLQGATSTSLFVNGSSTIAGILNVSGNAASNIKYASTTGLTVNGTASTSLLYVNGLGACAAGQYLTWANGSFGCATDQNTAGSAFTFGTLTFATNTAATTTSIWSQGVFFSSSTIAASQFPYASSTALSATNITVSGSSVLGTVTSGTWNGTTIGAGFGGTGQSTYASGDILYANTPTSLARVASSTGGTVLALVNGIPTWVATTTLANISGTLAVSSGGTGQTSFASSQLLYGAGSGAVQSVATSSVSNGTAISISGTGAVVGSGLTINFSAPASSALSIPYASTTAITATTASTTNLTVSSIPNALFLGSANGTATAYGGTSCTNQFVRSLNGAGAATCATVANSDLQNSSITINTTGIASGGGSVSLGSTITINASSSPTVGFVIATSTTQNSIFPYASSTAFTTGNLFATNATTTSLAITNLSTQAGQCLTISATGAVTTQSCTTGNFAYLFPANATSTLLNFNGGLTASNASIGATGTTTITSAGLLGIGTSTPFGKFAISLNSGDTSFYNNAFLVASSTGSATTTLFSINNVGSTTAANGFNISAGCYAINGACIGQSASISMGSAITGGTNGSVLFVNSGGLAQDNANFFWDATNKRLGLGTTSPSARLSVQANNGDTNATLFAVGSSTQTSTTTIFSISNAGLFTINTPQSIATGTLILLNGQTFLTAATTTQNTSLGYSALTTNSSGSQNTAIGYQALSAADTITSNTAVGYKALALTADLGTLTNSGNNTAVGSQALGSDTLGYNNTAVGSLALNANLTGTDNAALGYRAMPNMKGINNTAVGSQSGANLTSGQSNVAIGYAALNGSSATSSVAVGANAASGSVFRAQGFTAVGFSALNNLGTGGDYNTTFGYQAGSAITSGYGNILVGASQSANNLTTGSGNIGLGNNLFFPSVSTNNQLNIGNFIFGTIPATTTGFVLPTSGTLGIGTSTPFGKFAISLNNGDTSFYNNAFLVASSTGSATSTLFSISNAGVASTTNLVISSLNTGAGQCLSINATGKVITQACSSGSFAYPFSTLSTFSTTTAATSSSIWTQGAFFASSTNATSTLDGSVKFGSTSAYPFYYNQQTGAVGLGVDASGGYSNISGTAVPVALEVYRAGNPSVIAVNSNSTGIDARIDFGAAFDNSSIEGAVGYYNANGGPRIALMGGGQHSINAVLGIATPGVGTNNEDVLTVNGNIFGPAVGNVGIGTSTPLGKFTIAANPYDLSTPTNLFLISSSTQGATSTLFSISNAGVASTTNLVISSLNTGAGQCLSIDATGKVVTQSCSAGGAPYPFTPSTNFGAQVSATTSALWLKAGLQASSTARLMDISTIGQYQFSTSSANASSNLFTFNGSSFITASSTGFNTSLGISALSNIVGGSTDTALGYQALQNATSSTDNVAIGYQALQGVSTGGKQTQNVAVGNGAMGANVSGSANVALGYQSMFTNTTGSSNMAIGAFTLYSNKTGSFNAVVGETAAQGGASYSASGEAFLGYGAGFNMLTGADNNTLIGEQAGYNITTGANNIVIGADNTATNNMLSSGSSNILIGYDTGLASTTASNQLNIGNLLFGQGVNGTTGAAPSTGTIGIGTTTPFGKFAISLNNNDASFYNNAFIIASSTGSATSTLFAISNKGNGGFGTSTPWGQFSVNPNGISGPALVIGSSTKTSFIVTNNNNSGFGTSTPWGKLSVDGTFADAGKPLFTVGSSSGTYFLINNGGNVGIGTTSPFALFSINANAAGNSQNIFAIGSTTATTSVVVNNLGWMGLGSSTPSARLAIGNDTNARYSLLIGTHGSTTPIFAINNSGQVMIGTTTASTTAFIVDSHLALGNVIADFAGTSGAGHCFIAVGQSSISCSSDVRLKQNVSSLSPALDSLMQLRPVTYNWNAEASGTLVHTGLIAQEVLPVLPNVVTTDTNGYYAIDYAALTPYLISGTQILDYRLEAISTTSTSTLGLAVDLGTTTDATTSDAVIWGHSFFQNLFARITGWLGNAQNGIAKIFTKELVAENVTTKKLCLADDSGAQTCITKGDLDRLLQGQAAGAAATSAAPTTSASSPSSASTSTADTIAPVVTVQGNNPATVNVGNAYSDLGATATDNKDVNLSLKASVDGGARIDLSMVTIDTSVAADHAIVYYATDSSGNTGTAKRIVHVVDPAASAVSTSTASSTTP